MLVGEIVLPRSAPAWLVAPEEAKEIIRERIDFPQGAFSRTPAVLVGFSGIEVQSRWSGTTPSNLAHDFAVRPANISASGFEIVVLVGDGTRYGEFTAHWIAVSANIATEIERPSRTNVD